MITRIRNAALTVAAASMAMSPLSANVGDSMDRFMDDMGAAANVTQSAIIEQARIKHRDPLCLTCNRIGVNRLFRFRHLRRLD